MCPSEYRSERRRALHGRVRRPGSPPDPPDHGHRRVDALVGGRVLPNARRRRALRYPLRPPRHRPLDRLRPGRPGYTGADLIADAAGVLDAYGIPAAHLVGVSAGGAFAQLLATRLPRPRPLARPDQHSPAVSGDRALPAPDRGVRPLRGPREVDWSDRGSVIEYLVDYSRVLGGGRAARSTNRRPETSASRGRARPQFRRRAEPRLDPGGAGEPLSAMDVPTLVIHGTADPMFPIGHGEALGDEIPGASLLGLERAGHGVERADWETNAGAILDHTGEQRPRIA